MRKAFCVGASVASVAALALKTADTPTREKGVILFFFHSLTLCVWGKHSARTSTAVGGGFCAHYIGQKPKPTLLYKGT
jgi:hypothetical protein